ncbi:HAUS augmin-like complex subunit 6 N-terminal domain-containing protein [Pleurotus pulmonarius]
MANLPPSFLLLVHLCILDYPHANKSEYDQDLFNAATRGLRERAKTMEDVTYFLVNSIVGKKEARLMLPSYPCVQPADSTAFRVSLTKYLETLRNHHRDSKSDTSAPLAKDSVSMAMWKDTVVRKSLLEECAGERFERLILCFSTHAIFQRTKRAPVSRSFDDVPEADNALLRSQPLKYASLLALSQAKRVHWRRVSSLFSQRQGDLALVRREVLSGETSRLSAYDGLSTERLHSLAESKYRDLLRFHTIEDGAANLEEFLRITGLKFPSFESGSSSQPVASSYASLPPSKQQNKAAVPSPLPVAAAHHPAYLKKLKSSNFVDTSASDPSEHDTRESRASKQVTSSYSFASTAVADTIENERGTQQTLSAALRKARRVGLELAGQIEALNDGPSKPSVVPSPLLHPHSLSIHVNFETEYTPDLAKSLALDTLEEPSNDLESRIDYIRTALLPNFPDITTTADNTTNIPESRLPRAIPQSKHEDASAGSEHPRQKHPRSGQSIRSSLMQTPRRSGKWANARPRKRSEYVVDLIDGIQDDSVSFDEDNPLEFSVVTPSHPLPSGTPLNTSRRGGRTLGMLGKTAKKPSFAMPIREFELPSPGDSDHEEQGRSASDPGDVIDLPDDGQADGSDQAIREVDSEGYDEGPSMTLREILLHADTTSYDMIGNEEETLDETFDEWE